MGEVIEPGKEIERKWTVRQEENQKSSPDLDVK